jgi:hypothetical protein
MSRCTITEAVWERWQQLESQSIAEAIELLFTSSHPDGEAGAVMRAAGIAVDEFEQLHRDAPGVAELSSGAWMATVVPGGVAVRVDEWPPTSPGCCVASLHCSRA